MKAKSKIIGSCLAVLILVGLCPQALSADMSLWHKNGQLINHNGTIYLIKDTQRFGFRDLNEFLSWGYRFDMAVPANAADMALPMAGIMKARAGTMALDAADRKTVYLVFDDGAQPISGDTAYIFSSFQGRSLYTINLSDYPKKEVAGLDLFYGAHPAGSLVNSGGTIYLITASGKAAFPSAAVFYSYGYDFNMVFTESRPDQTLSRLADLGFRDGTLVNDRGTIFLISGNMKYGFRTWQGFVNGGYSASAVMAGDAGIYPEGEPFE